MSQIRLKVTCLLLFQAQVTTTKLPDSTLGRSSLPLSSENSYAECIVFNDDQPDGHQNYSGDNNINNNNNNNHNNKLIPPFQVDVMPVFLREHNGCP